MLSFGLEIEIHSWGTDVHLMTGDKVIFEGGSSAPATRCGTLDMYRTRMLAELYKFQDGFQLVFKEKNHV